MKKKVAASRKKTWKVGGGLFWLFELPTKPEHVRPYLSAHRDQGFTDSSFTNRWFASIDYLRERQAKRGWQVVGRARAITAIWPYLKQEEREKLSASIIKGVMDLANGEGS